MSATPKRTRRRFLLRVGVPLLLTALTVAGLWNWQAALPRHVRIAIGTAGGRYREVATALGRELKARHDLTVEFVETRGSVENIRLLRDRKIDLALFQPESLNMLDPAEAARSTELIRAVGCVYSEVLHVLVRSGSGVTSPDQLAGHTVSIGPRVSGDHATALLLLDHLKLSLADLTALDSDYPDILAGFRQGTLDAAFVTVGIDAEILTAVAQEGLADIVSVPYADALATRIPSLRSTTLPAGLFATAPHPVPVRPVQTVSVRAQLLTHEDVPDVLVSEVTELLLDRRFLRQTRLRELFDQGKAFAQSASDFALHDGAVHVYDPELKPLLPSDFVEATEGLRSFVVSLFVACWLAWRWFRDYRDRQQEHQLDGFIHQLLEIEHRQMDLDQRPDSDDTEALQRLLDDVTRLRLDALKEVSARDLNEDPAARAFIQMCHALSDKINAKLTRQRLQRWFQSE